MKKYRSWVPGISNTFLLKGDESYKWHKRTFGFVIKQCTLFLKWGIHKGSLSSSIPKTSSGFHENSQNSAKFYCEDTGWTMSGQRPGELLSASFSAVRHAAGSTDDQGSETQALVLSLSLYIYKEPLVWRIHHKWQLAGNHPAQSAPWHERGRMLQGLVSQGARQVPSHSFRCSNIRQLWHFFYLPLHCTVNSKSFLS